MCLASGFVALGVPMLFGAVISAVAEWCKRSRENEDLRRAGVTESCESCDGRAGVVVFGDTHCYGRRGGHSRPWRS